MINGMIQGIEEPVQSNFNATNMHLGAINQIGPDHLKTYTSDDDRPGTYFFFRQDNIERFFSFQKGYLELPVFSVKGIRSLSYPFTNPFLPADNTNRSLLGMPFYLVLLQRTIDGYDELGIYISKHASPIKLDVYFELALINLHGGRDRVGEATHVFSSDDADSLGWPKFIKQREVKNLGFLKNDRILVRAYVEILDDED